jgi:dCTP deaminase
VKLSDVDIEKRIAAGEIRIEPPMSSDRFGSMSVDLTLGREFRVFRHMALPFIDLGGRDNLFKMSEDTMESVVPEGDKPFYLHPGELALGVTEERIFLPDDIVGWLDGRSSLGRLGLLVHVTAHTIDPGWQGRITLEFVNIGPVPLALRPGMRICALSFEPLSSPTSRPYSKKSGAKYLGQDAPLASKISHDKGE